MIELAAVVVLGIFAQWASWKSKVPAILPLILIGLFVGPLSTLWTEDGCKWLQPTNELACNNYLFPGQYLFYFVSLSIGIILFEGGLTLKRKEIRGVGPTIGRLISLGSIITFFGGALAAHLIIDLNWELSLLFGALIIVTGPTVIAPILRNVPLNRKVSTVLKWEGILIDPIGALVAVLVFEFILSGSEGALFSIETLASFGKIVLVGTGVGIISAYFLNQMIRREWIPQYLLNVFTLALVLGVFVLSDQLAHESGLLTVVIMGMTLGNMDVPGLRDILDFKESISVLLISVLFILLSANIDMEQLKLLLDWRCLGLFAVVMLLLRPIGVFVSTYHSDLNTGEKLFISWVGPRGIVAAGVASLFGIRLTGEVEGAEYITPLVFMIVLGTVFIVALSVRLFAKKLKVVKLKSDGILIIGANQVSRLIGKYLIENDRHVVMVDNNEAKVEKARMMGIEALAANIYADDLSDKIDLLDIGYLLAMTASSEINDFACNKFSSLFGENGTFRVIKPEEIGAPEKIDELGMFSPKFDFINMSEIARDWPEIHEVPVTSMEHFNTLLNKLNNTAENVPLFAKRASNFIDVIPANEKKLDGDDEIVSIVFLGKELTDSYVA